MTLCVSFVDLVVMVVRGIQKTRKSTVGPRILQLER